MARCVPWKRPAHSVPLCKLTRQCPAPRASGHTPTPPSSRRPRFLCACSDHRAQGVWQRAGRQGWLGHALPGPYRNLPRVRALNEHGPGCNAACKHGVGSVPPPGSAACMQAGGPRAHAGSWRQCPGHRIRGRSLPGRQRSLHDHLPWLGRALLQRFFSKSSLSPCLALGAARPPCPGRATAARWPRPGWARPPTTQPPRSSSACTAPPRWARPPAVSFQVWACPDSDAGLSKDSKHHPQAP